MSNHCGRCNTIRRIHKHIRIRVGNHIHMYTASMINIRSARIRIIAIRNTCRTQRTRIMDEVTIMSSSCVIITSRVIGSC